MVERGQRQPRLFDFRMTGPEAVDPVITAANREAWALLSASAGWPGGAALVLGPERSGRTLLSRAWARDVGASFWSEGARLAPVEAFEAAGGRLVVDDADLIADEEALVRLFDLARTRGGAVVFVAKQAPPEWAPTLPDLASRLLAAPSARIREPDDALFAILLRRFCRERYVELSDAAVNYIKVRLPRSFEAAEAFAKAVDLRLERGDRPVSAATARQIAIDEALIGANAPGVDEEAA